MKPLILPRLTKDVVLNGLPTRPQLISEVLQCWDEINLLKGQAAAWDDDLTRADMKIESLEETVHEYHETIEHLTDKVRLLELEVIAARKEGIRE